MNILITGGAGYVGSVTVETLIERGHYVVVLDNLSTGYRQSVHPEAAFVLADIADSESVAFVVLEHGVEAAVHFATLSPTHALQNSLKCFENNTVSTLSLLKTLIRYGVRKFVFSSTAAVFGLPSKLPVDERTPIEPTSIYGESMYLIERILPWLNQAQGLSYVILRYFRAVGATEQENRYHPTKTEPIHQILQGMHQGSVTFDATESDMSASSIRSHDYLHVLDVAEAHVLALESLKNREARIYNLGNERGFSDYELIKMCRNVSRGEFLVDLQPEPLPTPDVLVVDSSRARLELGWRPHHSDLETIITSAWDE